MLVTGALPGLVPMHGLGGQQDLPIPFPLAVAAAVAALVVSFCVLMLAWRRPRYQDARAGRAVWPPLARVLDSAGFVWALRGFGLLFTAYVLWALVAGPDLVVNPVLGVFYVLLWVGLVPASLLLGPVVRALSPVRSLNLLLAGATGGDPASGLVRYPERLGYWPAALGLFGFVWQELVNPQSTYLGTVRLWLAVYFAVMLVGGAVFGEVWFRRADPFEVYSTLLSKLSFWGRDDDGRLVVRSPLANLATVSPRPGLVAVVAVLFGSTAYDSFKDTLTWLRLVERIGSNEVLVNTVALLAFCAAVAGTFTAAAMSTALAAEHSGVRHRELPRLLAHSVLPIIVGYMTAHYLSYLVEQGQRTLIQLSDPLVRGDNYLGTANWSVNYWLSFHPTLLASLKVLAVVAGHVVGVVAAHDRALRLLPPRHQVIGQLGMLVVMVGYTATGLYLLMGAA